MYLFLVICFLFFFKQKTAYEMRISDWSSDVCSSDLSSGSQISATVSPFFSRWRSRQLAATLSMPSRNHEIWKSCSSNDQSPAISGRLIQSSRFACSSQKLPGSARPRPYIRSEEHTSELQSVMRISYAVFCLKKKKLSAGTTV